MTLILLLIMPREKLMRACVSYVISITINSIVINLAWLEFRVSTEAYHASLHLGTMPGVMGTHSSETPTIVVILERACGIFGCWQTLRQRHLIKWLQKLLYTKLQVLQCTKISY